MRYLRLAPAGTPKFPPVVLIHGFLAYSFSWRHNLEALARERVVYALDLVGTGYSDRPSPEAVSYMMRDSARRILEWMKAEGLNGVDVVGTSYGGALALAAAIQDQKQGTDVVGRLVLVDPATPYMHAGKLRIRFFNTTVGNWAVRRIVANMSSVGPIGLGRMYCDSSRITKATRDGYNAAIEIAGTAEYAIAVLKSWRDDMEWLRSNIDALKDTPVLLVWGTKDVVVPVTSAKVLHAKLPKSELTLIPRAGHLPYEETPEQFNRVLLDYLNRSGAEEIR